MLLSASNILIMDEESTINQDQDVDGTSEQHDEEGYEVVEPCQILQNPGANYQEDEHTLGQCRYLDLQRRGYTTQTYHKMSGPYWSIQRMALNLSTMLDNNSKNSALQDVIGRPSTQDFIKYIEGNMILNINITRQDIVRTEDIFWPNLGSVKGKTTSAPLNVLTLHGPKCQENYWKNMGTGN